MFSCSVVVDDDENDDNALAIGSGQLGGAVEHGVPLAAFVSCTAFVYCSEVRHGTLIVMRTPGGAWYKGGVQGEARRTGVARSRLTYNASHEKKQ